MVRHELCKLDGRLAGQIEHGRRDRWRARESGLHVQHHHHENQAGLNPVAPQGAVKAPWVG